MKRIKTISLLFILSVMFCSCGKNSGNTAVENISETTISTSTNESENDADTTLSEDLLENDNITADLISDEQAIEAIRKYCCEINPDLESVAAEEYPVYWEITSSDDSEIVVLFRSYTGAQVRYYIDRATGSANITEFVPGITDKEETTGESINVRDYMN